MSISAFQSRQVASFLHYAFLEIRARISRQDYTAAADLAEACHNLPSFQVGSEHFNFYYFRRWFTRFHERHGQSLWNFLAMLNAIEAGEAVSPEVASAPLGTITPIAHEFITLTRNNPNT